MKYLKRFNEELKPWTYTQASKKLRDIGHTGRASRLEEWADKRRKQEEEKATRAKLEKLKKSPSFRMGFYDDKWNSKTRKREYGKTPFFEGNFYLECYFESDWQWDSDELVEYMDDRTTTLQFSFGIGIFPADEETQEKFDEITNDENAPYIGDVWRNTIWPINFTIRLNNNNTLIEQGKSETYWEERESAKLLFSDRREAMKFKRLLVSSLNGGDNFFSSSFKDVKDFLKKAIEDYNERDKYFWSRANTDNKNKEGYNSDGVPVEISQGDINDNGSTIWYWPFGDKDCNLKESDYQYFENAVKRMTVNNLYRD